MGQLIDCALREVRSGGDFASGDGIEAEHQPLDESALTLNLSFRSGLGWRNRRAELRSHAQTKPRQWISFPAGNPNDFQIWVCLYQAGLQTRRSIEHQVCLTGT